MSDLQNKRGALLLLPNLLGEESHHQLVLPISVDKAVATLDGLIAENPTAGRRFLGRFKTAKPQLEIPIATYKDQDLDFLLEPIHKGERWGLLSDAGLPCIADPGAKLVARARQTGIVVQAFVGPSSILLALMLSGLNGQRFAFHGYLEKDRALCKKQIQKLEGRAKQEECTQIFMEPPFRNQQMLELLLETLDEKTALCVAWELTLPTQGVLSQTVEIWKRSPLPNLKKRNAIFLFY